MGARQVHSGPARLCRCLERATAGLCLCLDPRFRAPQGHAAYAGACPRSPLRPCEEAMTLFSFSFILAGVLLNAGAQLLLKAGTNAMPLSLRLAVEPHILAGLACYVI